MTKLLSVFTSCSHRVGVPCLLLAGVLASAAAGCAAAGEQTIAPARGEIVSDIGDSCWYVFQDKDDNYWFGSDGNGVCRYDGKTLIRYTTKDGLAHDHVRGIQQHGPTCDILITTLGSVSKFDGKRFTTLPVTEMDSPAQGWELNRDDVWLPWQSHQMGPYRYDGRKLYHLKFPKNPMHDAYYGSGPNPKWSPYEVYCVYRDTRGHLWFGTSNLGIYRFDGKHVEWMYEDHLTNVPEGGSFGIRSIIEDRNGDFWFCNTQYRFDIQPHGAAGQKPGLLSYQRKQGMDLSAITNDPFIYYQSITKDNQGDLWMAPYAGGVWKYDGKTVTHYPMKRGGEDFTMFTIYKDNHGGLWVGTHENGAYRFNGKTFERFKV
jgi:ligand-binding sensor domain-containing protein